MLQQHRDHSGGNFQIALMTNGIAESRDEPNYFINYIKLLTITSNHANSHET